MSKYVSKINALNFELHNFLNIDAIHTIWVMFEMPWQGKSENKKMFKILEIKVIPQEPKNLSFSRKRPTGLQISDLKLWN